MKQKKILMVLTPIIVILLIGVIFFPTLIESIYATVTGQEVSCNDAPYAPNCFCPEGFNKQPTSTPLKVYCESDDLMFDPQSPTFQADSLAFAKSYLYEHFPDCDSIECPEPAVMFSDADIALTPEHRAVYFECRGILGSSYWETMFSLETGNMEKVHCINIVDPLPPQETPSTITIKPEWNRTERAYFQAEGTFSVDCTKESGIATATVNIPEGFTAESWLLVENGFSVQFIDNRWKIVPKYDNERCEITSQDSTTADIKCTANCPLMYGLTTGFKMFAYYPLSFMEQNYCKLSDLNPNTQEKFYSIGDRKCCADRNFYTCNNNLEWEITNTCSASSYDC